MHREKYSSVWSQIFMDIIFIKAQTTYLQILDIKIEGAKCKNV